MHFHARLQLCPSCGRSAFQGISNQRAQAHEQVDIGGQEHALHPLAANLPNIHVVDQPTSMCGALRLPYRRDLAQQPQALAACSGYHAVFAHADVVRLAAQMQACPACAHVRVSASSEHAQLKLNVSMSLGAP